MNLLLDTHTLLWWLGGDRRLGRRAAAFIAEPRNLVWVSAATAWEIVIKVALGRLDLGEPPEKCLPREIERSRFRPLPITVEHALEVAALPHHHTDPFDRLLIAQARREGMKMVTSDPAFEAYGISILSARA